MIGKYYRISTPFKYTPWCYIYFTITGLILLLFVPESPYYLILKKRCIEAKEIVQLLNDGDDHTIDLIFKDIESYIERGQTSTHKTTSPSLKPSQLDNVPDSEDLKTSQEQVVGIKDISNGNKIEDSETFLEKSDECRNTKIEPFGRSMIKIVTIMAGLFLFTRLCGKLLTYIDTDQT